MKRLLLLLFLLPLLSIARGHDTLLTLASPVYRPVYDWRFSPGDEPVMADPLFNDSMWTLVNAAAIAPKGGRTLFTGVGWFRLHFDVDSGLAAKPLALLVQHRGASEIYLDGTLLKKYGTIKGGDHSDYMDPQQIPLIFSVRGPGPHLLAIRYANLLANGKNSVYNNPFAGFIVTIQPAQGAVNTQHENTAGISGVFCGLTGIFFALFLLHILLYFYNRNDSSNMLFSFFSLSTALLFFTSFLRQMLTSSDDLDTASIVSALLGILVVFSLCGFLNYLFGSKKSFIFSVIRICTILATCLNFYSRQFGRDAFLVLMLIVGIYSIYLIIRAIMRKQPGARIIGAGLLLLSLFFIVLLGTVIIYGDIRDDQNFYILAVLGVLLAGSILSIPVSISAYLAYNFAAVNKSLKVQLAQVQELSQKTNEQEAEKQRMLESRKEELETEVTARTSEVMAQKKQLEQQHDALKAEKKKSDDLLLNILPEEVAEELKETGGAVARLYDNVSVLFTDFVDFTQVSERMSPAALVAEIDTCFKAFDAITEEFGLEKIKTVGDAYIAVAGLPVMDDRHAQHVVQAAIAIRNFMDSRRQVSDDSFHIRLGIHSGPVVAGIVGVKKFAYDIWGDTVNTAARMEQACEAGRINISAATYALIKDDFKCVYRGELEAKHKGKMGMYFVG